MITNSELRPSHAICVRILNHRYADPMQKMYNPFEVGLLPSASGWRWQRQRRRGASFHTIAVWHRRGVRRRFRRGFAGVMFRLDTFQHQLIFAALTLMNWRSTICFLENWSVMTISTISVRIVWLDYSDFLLLSQWRSALLVECFIQTSHSRFPWVPTVIVTHKCCCWLVFLPLLSWNEDFDMSHCKSILNRDNRDSNRYLTFFLRKKIEPRFLLVFSEWWSSYAVPLKVENTCWHRSTFNVKRVIVFCRRSAVQLWKRFDLSTAYHER